MIPNSTQIYNKFAPYYRHYSEQKSRYLATIDELVQKNAGHFESVLDVGCGDGVRGARLAKEMTPREFIMIDSSANMISLAKKFENSTIKVMEIDIIDDNFVETHKKYFDTVLCLWNVFGHITESDQRLTALVNIKNMMKENGVLCIDISNRYNISHYGFRSVLRNIWQDLIHPSKDNGNFSYEINVGADKILSYCHFFNPNEFPSLCEEVGLRVEKTFYVNYKTGEMTNRFGGHILYFVKKTPR